MVMQGRQIGEQDVELVRGLLASHPDWNRTRLSRELCARWNWHNAQGRAKDMAARTLLLKLERAGYVRLPARRGPSPNGRRNRQVAPVAPPSEPVRGPLRDLLPLSAELCRRWDWRNGAGKLKDMACRTLLLKLERAGHIRLPPRQRPSANGLRNRRPPVAPLAAEPIRGTLRDLQPLHVSVAAPGSDDARVFHGLLAHEHYLGHRNTVGENLRYLARDRHGQPVACALFGSAAWKCSDRDAFLGWDRATRERNLQRLTNNTRFLIPGWVQVPHLASHVLGLIARRIRADWQAK